MGKSEIVSRIAGPAGVFPSASAEVFVSELLVLDPS